MWIANVLAVLCGLGVAGSADAATYNVNRFDDPVPYSCLPPTATCTLRSALITALSNPSPPDVINLPAGNYANFQGTAFPLAGNVALVGAGAATTTVYGSDTSPAFSLDGLGAQTLSISGVTITLGHAGANPGGGISKTSTVPVRLTLSDVAIVNNTAASGGGIAFTGSGSELFVRDSLIAGNTTVFDGGGIDTGSSFARFENVTITGNTSGPAARGGGLATPTGSTYITSSTVSRNTVGAGGQGGNLYGFFYPRNTIIANGTGPAGSENCGAASQSFGHNVEDRNQCFVAPATGDKIDTDPLLGALAASPTASSTLALAPSSPAINTIPVVNCMNQLGVAVTRDQRAVPRPQGAACDAGAFEFAVPVIQGAPVISGAAEPGGTLTCAAPAVGSPDGPATSALAWLRDGAPAATGSTLHRRRRRRRAHAGLPHHGNERRRRCERDERRPGCAGSSGSHGRRRPAGSAASAERRRGPAATSATPGNGARRDGNADAQRALPAGHDHGRGEARLAARRALPRDCRDRRQARQDPSREQEDHPSHPLRRLPVSDDDPPARRSPERQAPRRSALCWHRRLASADGRHTDDPLLTGPGASPANMPRAPTGRACADARGAGTRSRMERLARRAPGVHQPTETQHGQRPRFAIPAGRRSSSRPATPVRSAVAMTGAITLTGVGVLGELALGDDAYAGARDRAEESAERLQLMRSDVLVAQRTVDATAGSGYLVGMAIDVARLPAEAEKLGDLTPSEQAVLPLVLEGLGSREIAHRLGITESVVYLTIADLLRALEFTPPGSGADDIHRRVGTRPASSAEVERFHEQFGPFASDDEG